MMESQHDSSHHDSSHHAIFDDDHHHDNDKGKISHVAIEAVDTARSMMAPETRLEALLLAVLCWSSFWMAWKRSAAQKYDGALLKFLVSIPFAMPFVAGVYLPWAVISCTAESKGFLRSTCLTGSK